MKTEFKDPQIGDYVVCIGENMYSKMYRNNSTGWEKNMCLKIKTFSFGTDILWFEDIGNGIYNDPAQLRFATPLEVEHYNRVGKRYNINEVIDLIGMVDSLDSKIQAMERRLL